MIRKIRRMDQDRYTFGCLASAVLSLAENGSAKWCWTRYRNTLRSWYHLMVPRWAEKYFHMCLPALRGEAVPVLSTADFQEEPMVISLESFETCLTAVTDRSLCTFSRTSSPNGDLAQEDARVNMFAQYILSRNPHSVWRFLNVCVLIRLMKCTAKLSLRKERSKVVSWPENCTALVRFPSLVLLC